MQIWISQNCTAARTARGNKFYRAVVEGVRTNSPIDEGWWLRRLQHDAGQIDVAPAFDVELRIAVDLCLRDCARDRTKLKWFLVGPGGTGVDR